MKLKIFATRKSSKGVLWCTLRHPGLDGCDISNLGTFGSFNQWFISITSLCIIWLVSGQNGTIDGQGKMWWELWWNRTLEHTRGHLLEIKNSHNILISNLTFMNSPFWTIHPVYCRFGFSRVVYF